MTRKDQVAFDLVKSHFDVEPHLKEIWRIDNENEFSPTEPIKLLEVNVATVATGSITPFEFAPTQEVPFPTLVAEVTPEEFEKLSADPQRLPAGWSLRTAKKFTRTDVTGQK